MGDLDRQEERWDAARCRESEDDAIARGRMRLVSGARHRATNRLVAFTDIGIPRSQTSIAYQWDTIVAPEHRGHRLGALIKLANLGALERTFDDVQTVQTWNATDNAVQTWNATDNAYMLAVNTAMGFEPVEEYGAWQLDV